MHEAYKDDAKLCEWLRENSSGSYRLSGYAAERIETLKAQLESVQGCCNQLEKRLSDSADTIDALVESGHISHHPQVELDALTDSMRNITQK